MGTFLVYSGSTLELCNIFRKAAKLAHMSRFFPLKCPSNYGNTAAIKGKLIQPKIVALFPQASHDPRNLHHVPAITIAGYTKPLLQKRWFCGIL